MVKKIVLLVTVVAACITGCVKDKEMPLPPTRSGCDSTAFYFREDIYPIFQRNCNNIGCHSRQDGGEADFTNYALVKDLVDAGIMEFRIDLPLGNPKHMPKDRILGTCEYFTIKTWIAQGAPE